MAEKGRKGYLGYVFSQIGNRRRRMGQIMIMGRTWGWVQDLEDLTKVTAKNSKQRPPVNKMRPTKSN